MWFWSWANKVRVEINVIGVEAEKFGGQYTGKALKPRLGSQKMAGIIYKVSEPEAKELVLNHCW